MKLLSLISQTKSQNNQIDAQLQQFLQVIHEIEKASGEVAQSAMTLNDVTENFLQP
jgi:heme-based aerotactic transducer